MRDPIEDLQIRVDNLQHLVLDLRHRTVSHVTDATMHAIEERLATMEFQFKELEKWHKRMWAVTQAESKIATLKNEAGEGSYPKARLKALKEANISNEDALVLVETFDTGTDFGRREKAIALGYWVEMTPIRELGKEWDITGARVQQIAHKALRKIRHRKIARKLLGADAPF